MSIDGVPFYVGEHHDFSFLSVIGKVFKVFYAMDSGNICFGVESEGKQYFVKYAGARTMDYKGEIEDAVSRLKTAVSVYEDLQHPYLIRLIDHYSVGNGYVAIFDWVNGEGLFSYWDYVGQAMSDYPSSPNYRFRYLPIEKRVESIDRIIGFHQHVIGCGYVPIDFYDGSLLYDFEAEKMYICDIDFYRKMPAVNDMGKMWGSTRFMAPEEYDLGALLDEIKTVFNMGAAMFELLGNGISDPSFEKWSATKSLYDVAIKAISKERGNRFQSIEELTLSWESAKAVNDIKYRQVGIEDIKPNMLSSFNRYHEVTESWRKQGDEYTVAKTPHIENWNDDKKASIVNEDFHEAIESGGAVFAAYDSDKLVGFAFYDGRPIGSQNQYYWLVMLHVSYEYRNKGIGKNLFKLCAESAKQCGANRFYISANSSVESQAFYRSIGCIPAEEINQKLFKAEPYDIHIECVL